MVARIESRGRQTVVKLGPSISITDVRELRELLLGVFEESGSIVFDFGGLEELDVAALQLFCGVCKSALGRDKTVGIGGGFTPAAKRTLEDGGFTSSIACSIKGRTRCLWQSVS